MEKYSVNNNFGILRIVLIQENLSQRAREKSGEDSNQSTHFWNMWNIKRFNNDEIKW